jgi:hypothetical protein
MIGVASASAMRRVLVLIARDRAEHARKAEQFILRSIALQ